MASFFNLYNVSNVSIGSSRGRAVVSITHFCPRCQNADSRSLEIGYIRDEAGWSENNVWCYNCKSSYSYSFSATGIDNIY